MNKVSRGDVYFLKSPFNSTVGKDHAKRISYLLGTIPSRPAVVIRAPAYWDTYGEVVVVPATHNMTEPGIKISAYDRYDKPTDADYNFCVHAMHTVPVTRLGTFLGRLTDEELTRITNAAVWVVRGADQYSVDCPEDYKKAIKAKGENAAPTQTPYRPEDNQMNIDGNMVLTERTPKGKVVMKTGLDINYRTAISPVIGNELVNNDAFKVKAKKSTKTNFPKSIFAHDHLCKYASRFNYDEELLKIIPLKSDTLRNYHHMLDADVVGMDPNATITMLKNVYRYYDKMQPADVYVYGVWLPKNALMEMTGLDASSVSMLKRLCNISHNVSQQFLLKEKHEATDKPKEVKSEPVEPKKPSVPKKTAVPKSEVLKPKVPKTAVPKMDTKTMNARLNKLKEFLTEATYMYVPDQLLVSFDELPKFMVRKYYKGRKFDEVYKELLDKSKALKKEKGEA